MRKLAQHYNTQRRCNHILKHSIKNKTLQWWLQDMEEEIFIRQNIKIFKIDFTIFPQYWRDKSARHGSWDFQPAETANPYAGSQVII